MKKCFICGRDYDELCHYCVKEMTIGVLPFRRNDRIYQLHNVEFMYEEGNDRYAEPEGTGAGLNMAQKQDG